MEKKISVGVIFWGIVIIIIGIVLSYIGISPFLYHYPNIYTIFGGSILLLILLGGIYFLTVGIFILLLSEMARLNILLGSGMLIIASLMLISKEFVNSRLTFKSSTLTLIVFILINIGIICFFTRPKVKEQFK